MRSKLEMKLKLNTAAKDTMDIAFDQWLSRAGERASNEMTQLEQATKSIEL